MEVHRPRGPFSSFKDFVVEIATIVVGVLIALSFEGLREWNHNRTLAREARDTIIRELTDNKKAVDGDLRNLPTRKKHLDEALQFADDILKSGKTAMHTIEIRAAFNDLSMASWQTAEHTGALGQMSYAEVQKYAAVYALQEIYQTQERRSMEHVSSATAALAGGDPTRLPRTDIDRFRAQLLTLRADLLVEEQLGRQLSERYAKALQQ
jgi:uncharacterized protein (UPF0297 family)